MSHWQTWHDAYADPESPLTRRLRLVQAHIDRWLDQTAPRPVRVVSVCAGEGRDLLDVLAARDDADRVTATLVELDPALADRAREAAADLPGVQVLTRDAGDPAAYAGLPPADLVLMCGVFGNVSDADVAHTVAVLPALCAPEARVIWTRTRRPSDLTPAVRRWFTEAGFAEVAFDAVPDSVAAVGVADLSAGIGAGSLGEKRLFTFLDAAGGSTNAQTLAVYEQRADVYRDTTGSAPPWYGAFLDGLVGRLPPGAQVLEVGSGTGRDARHLRDRGLDVQPSDGAAAFVEQMRADGLDPLLIDILEDDLGGPWDAVVAFAVLLHLTPAELADVLRRMHEAVRPGGLLALAVKEGDGFGWSSHKLGLPRYFTCWRPGPLRSLLESHGWRVDTLEQHAGQRDDWIEVVATRVHEPAG